MIKIGDVVRPSIVGEVIRVYPDGCVVVGFRTEIGSTVLTTTGYYSEGQLEKVEEGLGSRIA